MRVIPTSCFRALKTALSCHKDLNNICTFQLDDVGLSIFIVDFFGFTQYQFQIALCSHSGTPKKIQTSIDLDSKEAHFFLSLLQTSPIPLQISFQTNTSIQILNPNTHILLITLPFVPITQSSPINTPISMPQTLLPSSTIEFIYVTEDLIKSLLNIIGVSSIVEIELKNGILHYRAHAEEGNIHISKPMNVNKQLSFISTIVVKYVNTLRNLLHSLKTCKLILHPSSKQVDCLFRMDSNCFCRFSFSFYPYSSIYTV